MLWYRHCPGCGEEGELAIRKRIDTGRLCLRCAECFVVFDRVEDSKDYSRGDVTDGIRTTTPTEAEIREAGWQAYCVFDDDDEFPVEFT